MVKNYMADVAKMLGVKLGEEFKISNDVHIYRITKHGVEYTLANKMWDRDTFALLKLLNGEIEIIKLTWQPKKGDRYYFPIDGFTLTFCAIWCDSTLEYALKEAGMIFKTKEECEAALPELRKKYLGGDDNV